MKKMEEKQKHMKEFISAQQEMNVEQQFPIILLYGHPVSWQFDINKT